MMNPIPLLLWVLLLASPALAGRRNVAYIKQNSPKDQLKAHFQQNGEQCLTDDIYNGVREDDNAMSYYIDAVCSLRKNDKAKDYIKYNYGTYVENLGAGSFGVVDSYVAPNGTYFAIKKPKTFKIKLLFEELNASACIRELLGQKCELDENFAMIIQCVKHDSPKVNLIMKFFPETLEDKMKKYYTSKYDLRTDQQKLDVLLDMKVMTEELTLMHSVGLAHRDLKPENVMINNQQRPILVDFGFTTPNFNLAKTSAGTPLYMDYMIIQGKANGQLSDLYAMAMIFYEMTHGNGSNDLIEKMCLAGGYPKNTYFPDMNILKFNPNFAWLAKFTTKQNRWTIKQMLQKIEMMIADIRQAIQEKQDRYIPTVHIDLNSKPRQSFTPQSQQYDKQSVDDILNKYKYLNKQKKLEVSYNLPYNDDFKVNQKPRNRIFSPIKERHVMKVNLDLFEQPMNYKLNKIAKNVDTNQFNYNKYTPPSDIYGQPQKVSNIYYRPVDQRKVTPPQQVNGYPSYNFQNNQKYFIL